MKGLPTIVEWSIIKGYVVCCEQCLTMKRNQPLSVTLGWKLDEKCATHPRYWLRLYQVMKE